MIHFKVCVSEKECVECFVSMNVVMIALSLVLIKYDSSNWEQNLEVLQDKGRINEEFILQ